MRTVAIDFETAYDGVYNVADMGTWAYSHDPRFRVLQVALHGDVCGVWQAVGDVPWGDLHGARLLAHNAGFDRAGFDAVAPPGIVPAEWVCTAGLAAYHGLPRSLDGAVGALFGVTLDKSVRDRIQHGDLFDDVAAYAAGDAEWCWRLWERLGKTWPAHERRLSALTLDMGRHGLPLDVPTIQHARGAMRQGLAELIASVPFAPATGPDALKGWCNRRGVPPPKSTAKGADLSALDDETLAMCRRVQDIRSANRTAALLDSMALRAMPNGRMAYDLKYFGAGQTGRWSGGGGFNVQNLNRAETAGQDVRGLFACEKGRSFVIVDYAQIEARVLLWLAGERQMLARIEEGMDLYEAAARQMLGYTDPRPIKEVASELRQLAKAMTLGLGFGMGAPQFVKSAKTLAGVTITFEQARDAVNKYRKGSPNVVSLWHRLATDFDKSSGKPYHQVRLPSGRTMTYWEPLTGAQMTAAQVKGGERCNLHPGLLAENLVQATARDVMASAWLRCVDAGYTPVLSVHDELVFECPTDFAAETELAVCRIMAAERPWTKGLPIAVEAKISRRYQK